MGKKKGTSANKSSTTVLKRKETYVRFFEFQKKERKS